MTEYKLTDRFNIQLNINNVFDTKYYDQIHPGHIVPGEGRNIVLSSKYSF